MIENRLRIFWSSEGWFSKNHEAQEKSSGSYKKVCIQSNSKPRFAGNRALSTEIFPELRVWENCSYPPTILCTVHLTSDCSYCEHESKNIFFPLLLPPSLSTCTSVGTYMHLYVLSLFSLLDRDCIVANFLFISCPMFGLRAEVDLVRVSWPTTIQQVFINCVIEIFI